ncbi:MAG: hypothetical protein J6Y72_11565 [Bacteroidales bacterium]|nr:hypothetical protein [Bacteroidales bacterium]
MAILLPSCSIIVDKPSTFDIMGTYATQQDEHLGGEYSCDAHFDTRQSFNPLGLTTTANTALTFNFDGLFEFPSLTLNYELSIDGDWSYADSTISMELDTTTFSYTYINSTAHNYTEESMVRYLRKEVDNNIAKTLCQRLRSSASRDMHLISFSDSVMHVSVADTIFLNMYRQ